MVELGFQNLFLGMMIYIEKL